MTHDTDMHLHLPDPPPKRKIWPEAWSQLVIDGYAAGLTPSQVAANLNAKFGCILSGHTVYKRGWRMGLTPGWRTEWTDERKARLAELLADPQSGSYEAIARKLNYQFGTTFSRNAVIGQAKRSGLASKKPASPADRYDGEGNLLPKAPRKKVERKRPVRQYTKRVQEPRPSAQIIRLRCAEVISRNLSFAELEPNDCRYAEGEVTAEFRFCGNPKHTGSSYCTAHFHLSLAPSRDSSKRRAVA